MQSPYSPDTVIRPLEWMADAACTRHDPDDWFRAETPNEQALLARVQGICVNDCPVRERCLDLALEDRIEFGVWGGLTGSQRRAIRAERNRKSFQAKLRGTA